VQHTLDLLDNLEMIAILLVLDFFSADSVPAFSVSFLPSDFFVSAVDGGSGLATRNNIKSR